MMHPIIRILDENEDRHVTVEVTKACSQVDLMLCENHLSESFGSVILPNGNLEYRASWEEYLKYREQFVSVWNAIKEYRIIKTYVRRERSVV